MGSEPHTVQNKGLIFKKVPDGWPVIGQDLAVEDRPFDLSSEPPENGLITKNHYLSFDPYQRGRMRAPQSKSYAPPFTLGQPFTNSGIATVLKSGTPQFKEGDVVRVSGALPTEEYSVLSAEIVSAGRVEKLQNPYNLDAKLFLGALGMPGLTAYSSFYAIGQPKRGETIFVSAASGAVGQLVGQLAKREGLKVVGSVGDEEKLRFVEGELGFDGCFNYKREGAVEGLKRVAEGGIDIYYENVGGETLEAAIGAMKNFGRIVASGMISQYNAKPDELYGVKNLMQIVGKRIKMQGFIVGDPDMGPKYSEEHQKNVQKWIHEGSLKVKMSETKGIDDAAEGFLGMLSGKNFGKAILVIDELR